MNPDPLIYFRDKETSVPLTDYFEWLKASNLMGGNELALENLILDLILTGYLEAQDWNHEVLKIDENEESMPASACFLKLASCADTEQEESIIGMN